MKAEVRRLKGAASLCAALLCVFVGVASAQKRPKPALSTKEARRAIAAAPRFGLSTGAVKVKNVGPAGTSPVVVEADVTLAFRFERVEDERVPQTGGVFTTKRWRAVEFRTGDRSWEEFELISSPAFAPRIEAARRALEELVTEFEARQSRVGAGWAATARDVEEGAARAGEAAAKKNKEKKREEEKKAAEPLTRGPLTVKQLSLMGSSAVAEVVVAAAFSLERDARGRWRVSEASAGGESSGDLEELWRAADALKAGRVRAELAAVAGALEAFRRERGFYVVARDSVVLFDHLSPRYAKRIIRLDPWHNPYRYEGTAGSYTLGSDGPDGKQGTADDLTVTH